MNRAWIAGMVIAMSSGASSTCGADRGLQNVEGCVFNRAPLAPSAFAQLPLGSIKAKGWLAEQLRLQAEGLTGHIESLFEDVGPNSAWLGGNGEDWERGPYYLRGAAALAYAGGDPRILANIRPWIEWTLNSQQDNGNFGPAQAGPKTRQGEGYDDWWSRMIMLQVVQMHHEATGDQRVIPFMTKYFAYQRKRLHEKPLKSWAHVRGGDNIDSVYWLYNRTGEKELLHLAELLAKQTADWASTFLSPDPIKSHVVNLSQGYKQPGVCYQQSKDPRFREAVYAGLANATKYHGRIDGLHAGDEAEAGLSGTRGTELCAVVEFMHSMETLLRILGDAALADRLERVACNALPAMLKPDWRGHQYFSQPNQVLCTRAPHGFSTDHGDDLTLGVLTGYPCCATNMHMGWPKLAHHLWLATPEGGLAAAVYAPCEVKVKLAGSVELAITEDTDYPFDGRIVLKIDASQPVKLPLSLRIPAWCRKPSLTVNGADPGVAMKAGAFTTIDREWKRGDTVTLVLPMELQTSTWENNSVGIERGPLVFALAVKEDWRKFPDWRRADAVDDWPQCEVHPASPWNYGLIVDRTDPAASLQVESVAVPAQPWAPDAAPLRIRAKARKLPGWAMGEHNNAAPPPPSPVTSAEPVEDVTLLPFGATRLRISYIPVVKE